MLILDDIPAFENKDLKWGTCALKIEPLLTADTLESAWALLPNKGEGVVVCAGEIRRYNPGQSTGLLLDADVVNDRETVMVRSSGQRWLGWRWSETDGTSHRYVEHTFLSSEPGPRPPHLVYRQYWVRDTDDELAIWRPIGSRFCGFQEASR